MLNQLDAGSPRIIRPEYRCAVVAILCFAMCAVWPASSVPSALIAFVAFCLVLLSYKLPSLTNLTFVFLCFTLLIIISNSILWSVLLTFAHLDTSEANDTRNWAMQYIGMAIDAMVLGACLVKLRHCNTRKPEPVLRNVVLYPSIYLTAAFIPLFLNVILYYFSLRGLGYIAIYVAVLGPSKYIIFLIVITHAAFMRLFGGWTYLGRNSRLTLAAAVCLFFYIYVFLMPMRVNLFIFGMYSFYFLGRGIRWRLKVALLAGGIVLFSWIAIHRGSTDDTLNEMGFAEATVSAMSFGTLMVDMVPWAYDEVRSQGTTWGLTSLSELVTTKYSPGNRFAQDKSPLYFESGGGYGFFYIAELLLNFGYWGGLLSVCILGMALQKISMTQSVIVRSTVLPALLGGSFPLMRNDVLSTLKGPIYIIISCFILDRLALYGHELGGLIKLAKLSAATKQKLQFHQRSNPL
jgi:hypothetical protein